MNEAPHRLLVEYQHPAGNARTISVKELVERIEKLEKAVEKLEKKVTSQRWLPY